MMKLLIFGGTGILGEVLTEKAIEKGYDVTTVGTELNYKTQANFVHVDKLIGLNTNWDAIVDIFTFDKQKELSKLKSDQIIVLSSTLVYDRSKWSAERIYSKHPKAKKGTQGGYVDHKLELEDFWSGADKNWTILRPYHIIGPNSYLGCLPPHNRDPLLLEYIRKGEISLCDSGRVPLNIVHPKDIAEVILRCISNSKTVRKFYNLINPEEVVARDYYLKIAEILGVDLKIKNIPGEDIWSTGDWKLTTLPHLYNISDLLGDVEYLPSIGLEESLRDAIDNHPPIVEKNNTSVHKRMHIYPEPRHNMYFK
jgi:nucleoside-diphosphate-sugar epimerase